jgi:hypothetical protein
MNKMYFILSGISQSGLVNWNLIAKRIPHIKAADQNWLEISLLKSNYSRQNQFMTMRVSANLNVIVREL